MKASEVKWYVRLGTTLASLYLVYRKRPERFRRSA